MWLHDSRRLERGGKKERDVQCTWLGEVDERNPHVFGKPDGYYDITVVEVGV